MKRLSNKTLTARLCIAPILRLYQRQLEAEMEREIQAGTFSREVSAKMDALLFLLEE